jgi:hypothetical protein
MQLHQKKMFLQSARHKPHSHSHFFVEGPKMKNQNIDRRAEIDQWDQTLAAIGRKFTDPSIGFCAL